MKLQQMKNDRQYGDGENRFYSKQSRGGERINNDRFGLVQNAEVHQDYDRDTYQSISTDIQTEIRTYLKTLVQQKHPIKKLMISIILANLYTQQHNYQQAHQILTNIQITMQKLQCYTLSNQNQNSILSKQDYLDLAIITIKTLANFILIAIINVQFQLFQNYVNDAMGFLTLFLNGNRKIFAQNTKLLPPGKYQSQNSNPNIYDPDQSSKQQSIQFAIMLFKLFLKSFAGYESFEQIQAQTLIAQCQNENYPCHEIQGYFYFSNISFLKLLSTSDYQSAYKLEVCSYDFIEAYIEKSKRQKSGVKLKQAILKTVSLKKLLYLAEELKLPLQIIKMYKQKLYSSESLQSQYFEGLQENTIFRNYNEKINLGFRLFSRLKEFQKQYITPVELSKHSRARKLNSMRNIHSDHLQFWQCKALKNRFIQLMTSKPLQSNIKMKENILFLVDTLDILIRRHSIEGNRSQEDFGQFSVEENFLLQSIGCLRESMQQKGKKPQFLSLYESAVFEYKDRLEIFCSSLNQNLIRPFYEKVFQALQYEKDDVQPQISVQVYEDQEEGNQKQDKEVSESDSQPSIYLQDVEFEVIRNQQKKQTPQAPNHQQHQKYINQEPNYPMNQKKIQQNFRSFTSQNLPSQNIQRPSQVEKSFQSGIKYESRASKSPKKGIFLNEKNQVYVNYSEIGSKLKLSHPIPSENVNVQQKIQAKYDQHMRNTKETRKIFSHIQESVKNEEREFEIRNEQSVRKEKQIDQFTPLSHYHEKQTQKVDSIFDKFKNSNKGTLDSKITENIDQEKSTQQRSVNKSRRKTSSLSPKIPKDSTIKSRLNEHIKNHELSYSPESRISGLKSKVVEKQDQQESLSCYSADLSPSERSRSKFKPKVQKASGCIKSPTNVGNFQNKTIKFKEYMDNLQKSGLNINQTQKLQKNASKPKIESKNYHRRNQTEANQATQQNYQAYITGMGSKIKPEQGKFGVLQGFLAEPSQEAYKSMIRNSPTNQMQSPEKQTMRQKEEQKQVIIKPKRTGSQLMNFQRQAPTEKSYGGFTRMKESKETKSFIPVSKQTQQISITKSQIPKQSIISPTSTMLSPEMISNYVVKMMKSHKAKLNHAIKLCQNGQYVDKKHYSSDGGDERFLQLSLDHKNLEWAISQSKLLEGHKTKYQIKNIKGVVFGQVTETMRKRSNKNLQPFMCISFIFQKRTFDIYLSEENDSKFWLPGISYCVSRVRPQLNHANYTSKVQKFIKKLENPVKKDQYHSNTVYYSLGRVLWKRMLLKMQQKYLPKSKKQSLYKNSNAGAIIQFGKSMLKRQKQSKIVPHLPPTGKQSKMSKQKSVSQNSRLNQR